MQLKQLGDLGDVAVQLVVLVVGYAAFEVANPTLERGHAVGWLDILFGHDVEGLLDEGLEVLLGEFLALVRLACSGCVWASLCGSLWAGGVAWVLNGQVLARGGLDTCISEPLFVFRCLFL